jgi:hypothetical protein
MNFIKYLAEHPYSTISGLALLLRAARAVMVAHPDTRFDVALSVDVEMLVVGGVMLITGQDPKALQVKTLGKE